MTLQTKEYTLENYAIIYVHIANIMQMDPNQTYYQLKCKNLQENECFNIGKIQILKQPAVLGFIKKTKQDVVLLQLGCSNLI